MKRTIADLLADNVLKSSDPVVAVPSSLAENGAEGKAGNIFNIARADNCQFHISMPTPVASPTTSPVPARKAPKRNN
jgi:hypothetical protein